MYEKKSQPLLPRKKFIARLARSFAVGMLLLTISLFIGIAGYHWICGLPWIDAFLDASMILTGMGPVHAMLTDGAKIFASVYALFSGIIFLTTVGLMLAPAVHRLMHKFHLQQDRHDRD